jgi:hypothetical protein
MSLGKILVAGGASAAVAAAGCTQGEIMIVDGEKVPLEVEVKKPRYNHVKEAFLNAQVRAGSGQGYGNRRFQGAQFPDSGSGLMTDAVGSAEMPEKGPYVASDSFTLDDHAFAVFSNPLPGKPGYLQIFADNCILIAGKSTEQFTGRPEIAILMEGPYDLSKDKEGVPVGNDNNRLVARKRFAGTAVDKPSMELYTAVLNVLDERMKTGEVSRNALLAYEVARVRFENAMQPE